ncbi:MAG: DNA-methyltransferase [Desulfomonilaceae bacterium]
MLISNELTLCNMDCVEGSRIHLEPESVDLGLYDPPFGLGESRFDPMYNRDSSCVFDGYVEFPTEPQEYYDATVKWMTEAVRILKPNGSMYVVTGWTRLPQVQQAAAKVGLEEINHIVWKYQFGVYTQRKFTTSHYHVLLLAKPGAKRTFNNNCRFGPGDRDGLGRSLRYADMEDVWRIPRENRPREGKNPNKLPDRLVEKMVLYSSEPGDLVCDFFLGNFTTAYVARLHGRRVVGFELNKRSFDYHVPILQRCEQDGYTTRVIEGEPKDITVWFQPSSKGERRLVLLRDGSRRETRQGHFKSGDYVRLK